MIYENIVKGKFIFRPNRFVAEVRVNNNIVMCHVKNTGRCKELLVPNAIVYLEDYSDRMGTRKMRYSLIGVEKNGILINMDSQAPNKVVKEALFQGDIKLPDLGRLTVIHPEKTFGNSRFDLYLEDEIGHKAFVEVKGVTLEDNGIARFPDAPTIRGLKHVNELSQLKSEGFLTYIIFIIQMREVTLFMPNDLTHKAFGDGLRLAHKNGVNVLCYNCIISPNSITVDSPVPIKL